MSTLKLENIQHPDSSTPAISLDSSGGMSGSFPYPNRNLLYNGAMQVHQRGTSATGITAPGYYTADRWQSFLDTIGTWTQTIENDGPSGSGFSKSLKTVCTTANNSLSASERFLLIQRLEGLDCQSIKKGSSSSKEITVSFWVKSNVTGTYVVNLWDADNTRQVAAQYTVNSLDTWEKKNITFPADLSGVLNNDNGESFTIWFCLAAGPTYTSGQLSSSWETSTPANRHVGQVNVAAATNNYWQITGVQLETGSVATLFEHRSYGDELTRCRRYFRLVDTAQGSCANTVTGQFALDISGMRAIPTVSVDGPIRFTDHCCSDFVQSSAAVSLTGTTSINGIRINVTNLSGMTANRPGAMIPGSPNYPVKLNSEL